MILLGIAEACPYLILKSSVWSSHTTAATGIQGYRLTVLANSILGGSENHLPNVPHFREPRCGIELDIRKAIAVQYSFNMATHA
jgi:hypothetical protein